MALAVVVVGLTAACGGADPAPPPEVTADTGAVSGEPAEPTPSAPPDLAEFEVVDRATWSEIDRSPDEAEGRRIVVYTVVAQAYQAAPGTYSASVATSPPAGVPEGTQAVVRGDPAVVGEIAAGDVLRVHAEVVGTYAGTTGGSVLLPELRVVAAEKVAPYDLLADVVLGPQTWTGSTVVVPVTAVNSADTAMEYQVDVVATTADGLQVAVSRPQLGLLEPGQAATLDVRLQLVPSGSVVSVGTVTRSLPVGA